MTLLIGEPRQGRTALEKDSSGKASAEDGHLAPNYSLSGSPHKLAARLGVLGIQCRANEPFACILPGHDHAAEVHPAGKGGHWVYSCAGLERSLEIGGVRAALAYGETRHLRDIELCRWLELLDCEAGLLAPSPLPLIMPEPCPRSARIVAEHMRLFVGLREPKRFPDDDKRFSLTDPFVFAGGFGVAYTGLTADQVREGKAWLEEHGLIRRAGLSHRAVEWQLAGQAPLFAALERETS